jgi:hypothetical protein
MAGNSIAVHFFLHAVEPQQCCQNQEVVQMGVGEYQHLVLDGTYHVTLMRVPEAGVTWVRQLPWSAHLLSQCSNKHVMHAFVREFELVALLPEVLLLLSCCCTVAGFSVLSVA